MKNLTKRLITAFCLLAIIIPVFVSGIPVLVWGLFAVVTLLCLIEFFQFMLKDRLERIFGIFLGMAVSATIYWIQTIKYQALAGFLIIALPMFTLLFRRKELKTVPERLGTIVLGAIYLGAPFALICNVNRAAESTGWHWLILAGCIAFLGDTFGMMFGKNFGKRKLIPDVSPGKTWAGAYGGLLGSALGGVFAHFVFMQEVGLWHCLAISILGGIIGQCGDLFESLFKRARGIKDSGSLLPGHGGILDRVDGALFVAVWTWVYYNYILN